MPGYCRQRQVVLLSSRMVISGLAPSDISFRIVPLAFGFIGLLGALLLLRQLFTPILATLGFIHIRGFHLSRSCLLALLYNTQLPATAFLLHAPVRYCQHPSFETIASLLVLILVTTVFSSPSVFLLAAVFLLMIEPQLGTPLNYLLIRRATVASLWVLLFS